MNKFIVIVALISIVVGGIPAWKYFNEYKLKEAQGMDAVKEVQKFNKGAQ